LLAPFDQISIFRVVNLEAHVSLINNQTQEGQTKLHGLKSLFRYDRKSQ